MAGEAKVSNQIVLLGDSIFDNATYTGGEPDVLQHLRSMLPDGWDATLHAVDGSTTGDLKEQLGSVPSNATQLVVSIGGNDALLNSDLLNTPVQSTAEALALFGARARKFEADYATAIDVALALGRETLVCTIYNGNLEPPEAPLARVALMLFNDAILRTAFARGLAIIDLRFVCDEPADYANPIEPSGTGGRKIATAIAKACGAVTTAAPARVHVG